MVQKEFPPVGQLLHMWLDKKSDRLMCFTCAGEYLLELRGRLELFPATAPPPILLVHLNRCRRGAREDVGGEGWGSSIGAVYSFKRPE